MTFASEDCNLSSRIKDVGSYEAAELPVDYRWGWKSQSILTMLIRKISLRMEKHYFAFWSAGTATFDCIFFCLCSTSTKCEICLL